MELTKASSTYYLKVYMASTKASSTLPYGT